jgi:hypothetical protein
LQADPRDVSVSHPYIGYLHKPNQTGVIWGSDFSAIYHTDGYGFRNAWPWSEEADIVALGDSLTFGYGVEDGLAWPALLQQALPQVHVLNLGLSGAGPPHYVRVYETFGRPHHPKLILVGLFAANDFQDARLFNLWEITKVGGNYLTWRNLQGTQKDHSDLQRSLASLKAFLGENSYLYSLVHHAREVSLMWRLGEPNVFKLTDGSQLQLLPSFLASRAVDAQPERHEFQLVLQNCKHLQALSQEDGAQLLVVFLPSKEEVYLPLLGKTVPDLSGPLRLALERLGIPALDLTPAFRRHAAAGQRLFFEVDSHPNQQGYELIAQEILTHLKENAPKYRLYGLGQNPPIE